MPRRSRISVAHYPHHIVQRGHNRRAVFVTDKDRMCYLETLQEFRQELQLRVYGYCLMTNHVHLIVDPGSDAANLGLLMKRLAGRHTRRLNRLERRSGTAWEGRCKCSPIQSDRYLLACSRYVDLNPVRAKMVAAPEDYPWSSYRARIGAIDCPWLDPDPCYRALGSTPQQRQQRYQAFVEQGIGRAELEFIRGAVQRINSLGTTPSYWRSNSASAYGFCIADKAGRMPRVHRERGRTENTETNLSPFLMSSPFYRNPGRSIYVSSV